MIVAIAVGGLTTMNAQELKKEPTLEKQTQESSLKLNEKNNSKDLEQKKLELQKQEEIEKLKKQELEKQNKELERKKREELEKEKQNAKIDGSQLKQSRIKTAEKATDLKNARKVEEQKIIPDSEIKE